MISQLGMARLFSKDKLGHALLRETGVQTPMVKKTYPYYFLIGAVVLYTVLSVVPGVLGIGYSFTDWNSYSPDIHFVGLQNFKTIFSSDEDYSRSIRNTLVFTAVTVVFKTVLGLLLALLLAEGIKGKDVHRAIIYMPAILSMLVTGLIFKSIFNPDTGLLNVCLRSIGLSSLQRQWLTDPNVAFGSVMFVDIWRGVGYIMTIILAGLQSINKDYYEAADIDGANWWVRLKSITLPLLKPSLVVTTVLNLFYGLKVFDIVYVLTNGGPGHLTEVMYTEVFEQFSLGNYGVGTALSSVMFVIMAIGGIFVVKLMGNGGEEAA